MHRPRLRLALPIAVSALALSGVVGIPSAVGSDVHGAQLTGAYRTITFPKSLQTVVRFIGPTGSIAGTYEAKNGKWYGFTKINGTWKSVSFPKWPSSYVVDIAAHDELLGGNFRPGWGGEVFSERNGKFKQLPYLETGANLTGGNVHGDLAAADSGSEGNDAFVFHDGNWEGVDPPAPPGVIPGSSVNAEGIDDAGAVVGTASWLTDQEQGPPAYAWELQNGTYTNIDDPEQGLGGLTLPSGIGPTGEVVGVWVSYVSNTSGAYVESNGTFADLPAAGPVEPSSIYPRSANKAGAIVGYLDVNGLEKGFEFVPH
jgi:hypothetical protein